LERYHDRLVVGSTGSVVWVQVGQGRALVAECEARALERGFINWPHRLDSWVVRG
jgi:hypothetical protein